MCHDYALIYLHVQTGFLETFLDISWKKKNIALKYEEYVFLQYFLNVVLVNSVGMCFNILNKEPFTLSFCREAILFNKVVPKFVSR